MGERLGGFGLTVDAFPDIAPAHEDSIPRGSLPLSFVIEISNECRLGGDQFESTNRSHHRGTRKDRSLEMNTHTTPDRIDYHLTRAFVAIELQSQDRIDQAVDRLAISLLVQA
jgi:hypothetical protein